MSTETIAAIATSLSEAGISIIRISGPECRSIVDHIFVSKNGKKVSEFSSHTIHYGMIYENRYPVDEVLVSFFKGPNSFTAEDTVEINCHGGVVVTKKVLQLVLRHGARLAMPGEFTKRAFLNGRIDLTKAEAVMDIIHADNELALELSMKQLKGSVSKKINEIREKIIYEIAFIESALDDPEHISLDGYSLKLKKIILSLLEELKKLEKSADNGKIIKQGIQTVIVGKPNAGKSSFLNLLLGEEKAIVTDIAGTTRDILEDYVTIDNISFHVIDTAGIRKTEDVVEKIGVSKAIQSIDEADLLLFIVDSSIPLDENDKEIIRLSAGKKMIVLLNKTDLQTVINEKEMKEILLQQNHHADEFRFIKISAKEKIGLDRFEEIVKEMFFHGELEVKDEVMLSNIRQKEAVIDAIESLTYVLDSIDKLMPEDFLTIDLMNAYTSLGKIIGEEVGEDLINEIFSKFCMGK